MAKSKMRIHKVQSLDEGLGPGVFERFVRERDLRPGQEDGYTEFHKTISELQDLKRLERLNQRAQWKGDAPQHFATKMNWPTDPKRHEASPHRFEALDIHEALGANHHSPAAHRRHSVRKREIKGADGA